MDKLRLSGIIKESVVDGPGFRYVVFTQGCPHKCVGCHNPNTHSFTAGYFKTIDEIYEDFLKNPLLKGITLSGGEPFCQAYPLSLLAKKVKDLGKDVICYTGYLFEYLNENGNDINCYNKLLNNVDYLIDGKFEIKNKSLSLKFRGSTNQRIIDVKKSLNNGYICETDF